MKASTLLHTGIVPGRSELRPTLLRRAVARLRSASLRQTAASVCDQAVVSGTSFASSVLIGRCCAPEDLGVYSLALSVLLLARGVQGDVVSAPYLVYCHRRGASRLARYTGSSLIHQAALTLATLLAIGGFTVGISQGSGSAGLATAMWSVVAAAPFVLLREHLRQLSFAQLRLGEALVLDFLVALIQLGALGLLAWNGTLTVPAVYAAMGVGCALACLSWWVAKPDAVTFSFADAWTDWWSNWEFGRWTLASQLVSRAMSYFAPWLIALTHGAAATGLMAASLTVVNLVGMFVTGVSNYLTPRAARAYAEGGAASLRTVLLESLAVYLAAIGGFCAFLALTGDLLITFVYGNRFAGAPLVLLLLALQLLVNSVGIVVGNGLWAVDRPRANFLADVVTFVGTGAALAALVPEFGVTGAALGLLLGTAAGTVTRTWTLFRVLHRTSLRADSGVGEGNSP